MSNDFEHILYGMESFKFKQMLRISPDIVTKDYEISVYGLGDINYAHQVLGTDTIFNFSEQGKKKYTKCKLLNIPDIYLIGRCDKEYLMYSGHGRDIDKIASIVDVYMLIKCEYLKDLKAKIIDIDCYLKYDKYLDYGSIQATEAIKLYDCMRLKVKAIMCKYIYMSALREVELNVACLKNPIKICAVSHSFIYVSHTNRVELLSISNSVIVIGHKVKQVYLQNCFDSEVIIDGAYSEVDIQTKDCANLKILGTYDEGVDDCTRRNILEYRVETEDYLRKLNERT